MSTPTEPRDDGWDRGWDEHKLRQLRRLAKLSLAQKLEWLEEAQKLADALSRGRDRNRESPDDHPS